MTTISPGEVHIRSASVMRGTTSVLSDVDVHIATGAIHALVGPNGAGKTSLLKAIAGDLTCDYVSISGQELSAVTIKDLAALRAVVRPNHRPQFGYAVRDVVSWSARDGEVNNILETLQISHLANRSILELSSGQLAKVNLACVLVQQSDIIIADEPEAALDPKARIDMWSQLSSSQRTVVVATHALDLVMEFATHVTAIIDGHVSFTKKIGDTSLAELRGLFTTAQ